MRKRRAIHETFRHLVANGIAPESVAEQCGPQAGRLLVAVEGEVGADAFLGLAKEAWANTGRSFDPRRFLCGDDDLVHFGGRTYAFSSQWGGADWLQAMTSLRAAFPDQGIAFEPSA